MNIQMIAEMLLALAQLMVSGSLVYFTYRLWRSSEVLASSTKSSIQLQHASRIDVHWDYADGRPRTRIVDRRGLPMKIICIFKGNSNDTLMSDTQKNPITDEPVPVIRLRRWHEQRIQWFRLSVDPVEITFSPMRLNDDGSDTWVNLQIEVWYKDYGDDTIHKIGSRCTFECVARVRGNFAIKKSGESTYLDLLNPPDPDWKDDPAEYEKEGHPLWLFPPPYPGGEVLFRSE